MYVTPITPYFFLFQITFAFMGDSSQFGRINYFVHDKILIINSSIQMHICVCAFHEPKDIIMQHSKKLYCYKRFIVRKRRSTLNRLSFYCITTDAMTNDDQDLILSFNYPVIECAGFPASESGRRIYRARFSSVTEKDISKAMDNLVEPSKDEALAVDARQEIDLKVGVAFTRFQTRYFQGKYGNLDSTVISYVSVTHLCPIDPFL